MASASYPASHHRTRKAYAQAMADGATYRCGCTGQCRRHTGRCRTVIAHGTRWHLGHGIARARGGGGGDLSPWCVDCNLIDAANITNDRRHGGWSQEW